MAPGAMPSCRKEGHGRVVVERGAQLASYEGMICEGASFITGDCPSSAARMVFDISFS